MTDIATSSANADLGLGLGGAYGRTIASHKDSTLLTYEAIAPAATSAEPAVTTSQVGLQCYRRICICSSTVGF